jgi:hypothetical protein
VIDRIPEYVRHGADDASSPAERVIGFYLHWRNWALLATILVPVGLGLWAVAAGHPYHGLFISSVLILYTDGLRYKLLQEGMLS